MDSLSNFLGLNELEVTEVDELILRLISSGVEPNEAVESFNLAVEDLKNNKMSDNIAKLFNTIKDDDLVRNALNEKIRGDSK